VNDFIAGVQQIGAAVPQNSFILPSQNLHGMMVFDGLTARVEVLW
jgi:hypothetical protein